MSQNMRSLSLQAGNLSISTGRHELTCSGILSAASAVKSRKKSMSERLKSVRDGSSNQQSLARTEPKYAGRTGKHLSLGRAMKHTAAALHCHLRVEANAICSISTIDNHAEVEAPFRDICRRKRSQVGTFNGSLVISCVFFIVE